MNWSGAHRGRASRQSDAARRAALRDFWTRYRQAEQPLKAWFSEVEKANWTGPADIKRRYRTADFLPGDRVVFNISGNNYRLIVRVSTRLLFWSSSGS